jgi:hypothetical protein
VVAFGVAGLLALWVAGELGAGGVVIVAVAELAGIAAIYKASSQA